MLSLFIILIMIELSLMHLPLSKSSQLEVTKLGKTAVKSAAVSQEKGLIIKAVPVSMLQAVSRNFQHELSETSGLENQGKGN